MDNFRTFSNIQLQVMNYDQKYGSDWITYETNNHINKNNDYKLYATGDYNMSSGRIYIALPANKALTHSDKIKYNIIG